MIDITPHFDCGLVCIGRGDNSLVLKIEIFISVLDYSSICIRLNRDITCAAASFQCDSS